MDFLLVPQRTNKKNPLGKPLPLWIRKDLCVGKLQSLKGSHCVIPPSSRFLYHLLIFFLHLFLLHHLLLLRLSSLGSSPSPHPSPSTTPSSSWVSSLRSSVFSYFFFFHSISYSSLFFSCFFFSCSFFCCFFPLPFLLLVGWLLKLCFKCFKLLSVCQSFNFLQT